MRYIDINIMSICIFSLKTALCFCKNERTYSVLYLKTVKRLCLKKKIPGDIVVDLINIRHYLINKANSGYYLRASFRSENVEGM